MAKLSDGSSYRFFRLKDNFRTISALATTGNPGSPTEMSDYVDSKEFRLFNVQGRQMVPPRFWRKLAYFYVSSSDASVAGKLIGYQWNDLMNEFEKKCEATIAAETGLTALYHKFSMVSVGDDGVIFSQWNTGTFKVYKCDPSTGTMSDDAVTISNTANAEVGAQGTTGNTSITNANLILQQAREDPDSYSATGTYPPIYGLHGDGYILKFSWSKPTLDTSGASITVPVSNNIVMSPEWFDVGKLNLAVLQPVQCGGQASDTTIVTSAGFQVYNLGTSAWTCRDLTNLAACPSSQCLMDSSTTTYWNHKKDPPHGAT